MTVTVQTPSPCDSQQAAPRSLRESPLAGMRRGKGPERLYGTP
ncbi:MAG: hypothetical protein UHS51_12290 [Atopobiaceae bacterium]|jgi:hypothetical protein|nr:hypothetical protein [Atopobiaceae bacterium]